MLINFFFMLVLCLLGSISHATQLPKKSLDVIAKESGTDKSSAWHNYTKVYEQYFERLRDQPIHILEIGFLLGNSAKMWQEYFSQASLCFIDIDRACLDRAKNLLRAELFIIDQADKQALREFAQDRSDLFDIIIDDGSHISAHQIASFQALFPYLKSGGVYVIEDINAAYYKTHRGKGTYEKPALGSKSIVAFLQNLIHEINYVAARAGCANVGRKVIEHASPLNARSIEQSLTYYQKNIDAIHFYTSICFIFKK